MNKHEDILHAATDTVRAVAGKEKHKRTSAVIVAAGDSTRMLGTDKIFAEIKGMPVLARTVSVFESSSFIDEIVIVTKKEQIYNVISLCEKYHFEKVTAVVPGGATRQDSVWNGFYRIDDKSDFVVIHDGARCLVTERIIEDVCREAYIHNASTAANRSTDTVKISNRSSFVSETQNRDNVWLVQTPQAFNTSLYRAAAYIAKESGTVATDDCSLVEKIDFKAIKLCECGKENIKITKKEDLVYAELILDAREKGLL